LVRPEQGYAPFDPNVARAGTYSANTPNDIIGIEGDSGTTKIIDQAELRVCHWYDKRKAKQPMLHLTADFSAPDCMLWELIVNPPPVPCKD
jgi:hypothetical protein